MGTAKNAGKTTVLNQIIEEFKQDPIALTSIGLDGEKIDNVTNKPKPRIKVFKKMLVATAFDTLKEATCKYVLYEKTNINTPMGEIVIVEITEDGLILIAGPSTKTHMIKLVNKLKKYNPINIFIDGALFRKSLAATSLSDGLILSTGASLHSNMNEVVNHTKILIDQFDLQEVHESIKNTISIHKDNLIISKNGTVLLGSLWEERNQNKLSEHLNKDTMFIYLKGALTDKLIYKMIEKRHDFSGFTVIIRDATHIVCSHTMYNKLEKMNVKVKVLHKMNLLFLSYNPYSPFGYEFDNNEFKEMIENNINAKAINVLKDTE